MINYQMILEYSIRTVHEIILFQYTYEITIEIQYKMYI